MLKKTENGIRYYAHLNPQKAEKEQKTRIEQRRRATNRKQSLIQLVLIRLHQ